MLCSLSVCWICVFAKSNPLFMLIGIMKCNQILDSSVILLTSLEISFIVAQIYSHAQYSDEINTIIQTHVIRGKINLFNPIRILPSKSSHILHVVCNIILSPLNQLWWQEPAA